MHGYRRAMAAYAEFRGRAPLAEFWGFFVTTFFICTIASAMLEVAPRRATWPDIVYGLIVLVHLLPFLAVLSRRLHDSDLSGAWAAVGLIPIVNLLMLIPAAFQGTVGANRFGQDPLARSETVFENDGIRHMPSKVESQLRRSPRKTATTGEILAQLERLSSLHARGALSDEEFATMKAHLFALGGRL